MTPAPGGPRRSRRALAGLLAALAVSETGTRLSAIALPWFVLTTTGSPVKTGLVGFCEIAPYVVLIFLAGPVLDRIGPRRVSGQPAISRGSCWPRHGGSLEAQGVEDPDE